jgi:hypothetical protein
MPTISVKASPEEVLDLQRLAQRCADEMQEPTLVIAEPYKLYDYSEYEQTIPCVVRESTASDNEKRVAYSRHVPGGKVEAMQRAGGTRQAPEEPVTQEERCRYRQALTCIKNWALLGGDEALGRIAALAEKALEQTLPKG